jgi:hypothetical protein
VSDQPALFKAIVEAITSIQDASGRPVPTLTLKTDLLIDVDGFESLNCLEVLAFVSHRTDTDIPQSVLRVPRGAPSLTIGALVDQIQTFLHEAANA